MRRSILLLTLFASTALGANGPVYERVVAPFDTMRIAGAGTVWTAELRARNDGDQPVNLFPEACFFIGIPMTCATRIDVPAHTTRLIDLADYPFPIGVLFYVPQVVSTNISFNLRVAALGDPVGVEIPVIRERNFRQGTTTLIDVPLGDPGIRASLRVYQPDTLPSRFTVRVFRESDDALIYQRSFSFGLPFDYIEPNPFPALNDMSAALAEAGLQKPGRARVTIEADTRTQPYWPLLTITDNATQRIMTITPQASNTAPQVFDDPVFEQVLAPFDTMRIPGAGTTWTAELRARNDGDQPVSLFPETCISIGGRFPCNVHIDIPAHTTKLLDLADERGAPGGAMLYVPQGRSAEVSFNLRIGALGDPVGVEIPVIRQRNYRLGTTTLLHVPLGDPGIRSALRVYAPDMFGREITVRVYRESDDALIAQRTFFFNFPTDPPVPTQFPALLDVSAVLAEAGLQKPGSSRVVIDVAGATYYWPLLTVTDNVTQRVMTITPQ